MENKCSSLGISQRNTNISLGNKNILLCDHLRPSLVSRVSATQQKKIEVHRNEWSQASIVYQVTKVIPELTNQGSDARAAAPQLAALQEAASEWQFPAERQRCCLIMFCPRSSTLIPQGRRKCTVSNFCRTLHREKSYSRTPRPSLHVNSCWAAVPTDGQIRHQCWQGTSASDTGERALCSLQHSERGGEICSIFTVIWQLVKILQRECST